MTSRNWMHKVPAAVLSATILVFGAGLFRETRRAAPIGCRSRVLKWWSVVRLGLHRRLDGFRRDRQRAYARADRVEDGVTDRRRDNRHRRLAAAHRRLAVADDADIDFRYLRLSASRASPSWSSALVSRPRSASRCIRTCFGTPAALSSRTRASIHERSKRTWDIEAFNLRYGTPSSRRAGLRTCGAKAIHVGILDRRSAIVCWPTSGR